MPTVAWTALVCCFSASNASPSSSLSPPFSPTPCSPVQDRNKWQLKAHDEAEWVAWVQQQIKAAGISSDAVYVQVGGWQAAGGMASSQRSVVWLQLQGENSSAKCPCEPVAAQALYCAELYLPSPACPACPCLLCRFSWMALCAPAARAVPPGSSGWATSQSSTLSAQSSQTAWACDPFAAEAEAEASGGLVVPWLGSARARCTDGVGL